MKNFIKKSLLIFIFMGSIPALGIGRCECNKGCDAIVDHIEPRDILENDPKEVCPTLCARHCGWTGRFSNEPHPRPLC